MSFRGFADAVCDAAGTQFVHRVRAPCDHRSNAVPALRPQHAEPSTVERRVRARTSHEDSVTGLIQAIILNPAATATTLERDVDRGADPLVVLTLLHAAENLTRLRGLEIG